MRKPLYHTFIITSIVWITMILCSSVFADRKGRWSIGSNPADVGDYIAWAVNEDRIQDNALNDISNIQWQYASQYRITNTLDAIRVQITPYIQWVMYLWLSIAVILIVYNGFLMVTNSVNGGAGDPSKIKSNMTNIVIGVILLCSFYIIIQVWLAVIAYLTT